MARIKGPLQAHALTAKIQAAEHGQLLARFCQGETGRAGLLCPGSSDIDLLGNRESVVDLNPEIPDRAFDLGVAKQELNSAQVPRAAVDQRGLGATERMCAKQPWIQTNAAYPTRD